MCLHLAISARAKRNCEKEREGEGEEGLGRANNVKKEG
jgi:hypothetical protein